MTTEKDSEGKILEPIKLEIRNLVSYWDLDPVWQAEARRNHDYEDLEWEEETYVEPLKDQTPEKHYYAARRMAENSFIKIEKVYD